MRATIGENLCEGVHGETNDQIILRYGEQNTFYNNL